MAQQNFLASQNARWVFTLNNYTADDEARICSLFPGRLKYFVFGREVAPTTGTPHLQGFVIFKRTTRGSVVQRLIGGNVLVHIEPARADNLAASDYCKKDGDFTEGGEIPGSQGHRSDWDSYRSFVSELGRLPTTRELIGHNPGLYARYSSKCWDIARAFLPHPTLVGDSAPRLGWQTRITGLVQQGVSSNAAPRKVYFVVDEEGGKGKSWICRWAVSTHPDHVQVLRIGKRDDLAYSIDVTKQVFIFDVPRTQMMYLQYSVLEMLKDQMIYSPKYESQLKILTKCPQVIVMSNESPDESQLTNDRYDIMQI